MQTEVGPVSAAVSITERTAIKPLRDRIYIRKIRETVSSGGIVFPETFRAGKSGHSARLKMNAIQDTFHATVLAVGPESRELAPGDEVIVYSYAEGDGSKLFTGESVGEKDCLFIGPDDVVCAVDR